MDALENVLQLEFGRKKKNEKLIFYFRRIFFMKIKMTDHILSWKIRNWKKSNDNNEFDFECEFRSKCDVTANNQNGDKMTYGRLSIQLTHNIDLDLEEIENLYFCEGKYFTN